MKIPCRMKWLPTPVFLPEKSHGQRSLAGYSQWGLKELDTTEHTHMVILTLAHPAPTPSIVRGSPLPTPYQRPPRNQNGSLGKQGAPKNCPSPGTACLLKSVCLMRTPVPHPKKILLHGPKPSQVGKVPTRYPWIEQSAFYFPCD